MCSYAFDRRLMVLRCSDGLFLTFCSAVMFLLSFGFTTFGKNLVRECSVRLVMVMPLAAARGTTTLGRIDHCNGCSAKAMPMLVFKMGHRRVD
jgi:hypothetical protein